MGRGVSYKFHDYFCTDINIRFTFRIDKLLLQFVPTVRQPVLYRYIRIRVANDVRAATYSLEVC